MKYPLATSSWNNEEKEAAKTIIDSGMCTMGNVTLEFEKKFAAHFGSKYAVFSNSGSSANLLAVSAFLYRKNGLALKPGDEVIVPAVSWSTSYYPITQIGCTLKFVDINIHDFNISIEEVKKAIGPKTKAILAVNLLGMPCDLIGLKAICKEYNLIFIEDNCESMGASYVNKQCGSFADIGTHSLFFSHIISSVEGGVCVTDDEELYQTMICLRAHGWLRNLPNENHIHNKSGNYFEDTFKFVLPGYNVRPNDIFASIGLEQLKKVDSLVEWRQKNALYLEDCLMVNPELSSFKLQDVASDHEVDHKASSWFGFGFLSTQIDRMKVINHLTNHDIESRPIVAGNFCKNPVIKWMPHSIQGYLPNAKIIDEQGFFIGNNGEDLTEQIDYFIDVMKKLVE